MNYIKMRPLSLVFFLGIFFSCDNKSYVEFKEIVDDSENNYYESIISDSIYFQKIKVVLKSNGVDFKEKDGKVFIPKEIYLNKEYCKNVSKKAMYVELKD